MTRAEHHDRAGIRAASGKPGRWITACGLAFLLILAIPGPASAVCSFEPLAASVTGIGADGVLHLDDGTDAQIADIAIVRPDDALDMIRAEQAAIRRLVDGAPDRWGRLPVTLAGPDNDNVSRMLVRLGFARIDPGARPALCDPGLMAIEGEARRYWRGLWRDPANRPINARNSRALLDRIGEFVLVEGRVESVGVRERTTFIDFTKRWRGGFTVTVPNALWQEVTVQKLAPEGLDTDDLTGRRIRVRGVLQKWRGPAIELAMAAFIEILQDDS